MEDSLETLSLKRLLKFLTHWSLCHRTISSQHCSHSQPRDCCKLTYDVPYKDIIHSNGSALLVKYQGCYVQEFVCHKQNKNWCVYYFLILVLRKLSHWNCLSVNNMWINSSILSNDIKLRILYWLAPNIF